MTSFLFYCFSMLIAMTLFAHASARIVLLSRKIEGDSEQLRLKLASIARWMGEKDDQILYLKALIASLDATVKRFGIPVERKSSCLAGSVRRVAMTQDWTKNLPNYIGTDCQLCDRNRVEVDGVCEKCKYIQKCETCKENDATCFGSYEGKEERFSCDNCCGHGCEDGFCNKLLPRDEER